MLQMQSKLITLPAIFLTLARLVYVIEIKIRRVLVFMIS